jgi:hypothetical protein
MSATASNGSVPANPYSCVKSTAPLTSSTT